MRIISGRHRGRKIETVETKSMRPTSARTREAIFNILSHWRYGDFDPLDGAKVLDLYCGSGALALEALSRGAEKAVFVDIDQAHLDIARYNASKMGEEDNVTFIQCDSSKPPRAFFQCSLVFLDPPYNSGLSTTSINNLVKNNWLEDGAVIVVEVAKKEDFVVPDKFVELDSRIYGTTKIVILEYL